MAMPWRTLPIVVLLAVAGCAGAAGGARGARTPDQAPDRVTSETYAEAVRLFHRLSLDDPGRAPLRERIVEHLASRTPAVLDTGSYEEAIEHFAAITELYSPEELERGAIPRALDDPARVVLRQASRRGDEARALAALFVLRRLHPKAVRHRDEYRRVATWGRRARAHLESPLERYSGLIEVWDEHSRLTPAPDVLETVARLHIERRDAIVQVLRSGEGMQLGGALGRRRGFGMAPHHLLRRAPFEVAAVYLRHGHVASAISHLRAMGQVTDLEGQLLRVLEDVRSEGEEAASAILELAKAYRGARPDVAFGLCRMGLRRMPGDSRFPTCLARVATAEEHYSDATAWYAEAIELAPDERSLYDEALEKLNEFIERGLFESEVADARRLAHSAEQILEARVERWPESPAPVGPDQLHLLIGTLEMNAGNADAARKRFERSLEARATNEALLKLGLLEARTGDDQRAIALYRRALDRTPERTPAEQLKRAEILEHLADAIRESQGPEPAEEVYRRSLGLLDNALPELEGPPLSLVQVRRGVILDRLGQHHKATEAFVAAMAAAPHWRESYAGILSHLVVVAPPDLDLAHEVFRRAQRQLTLDPEWKVYFALWVTLVAGRAGEPPPADVRGLLDDLAAGSGWWARLAKFGAGGLPYDELLADASNLGERAEAHFYEGARRLASGDREGARRLFERVLSTRMVSFYEFVMAQELTAQGGDPGRPAGPAEP